MEIKGVFILDEYILNLLPLTDDERETVRQLAPRAAHIFTRRSAVTESQLSQATIILGSPVPADMSHCSRLKWIQTMWAGADEYLTPGVLGDEVVLTTSSGSNSQAVAEHMLACLLALCRKLPQCRDYQRDRVWGRFSNMKTICDATVLVVGAGHIGGEFAARCKALGSYTIGLKRRVTGPVKGFDQTFSIDYLDELLPAADVVILCLPHSADTVELMNRQRLSAMKPDAILLSCGRGTVLDQQALAELMGKGHLWGVALDVTHPEPLSPTSPLWNIPNLLITPHIAGGMRLEITRKNCVRLALENLERWLKREQLINQVHRSV